MQKESQGLLLFANGQITTSSSIPLLRKGLAFWIYFQSSTASSFFLECQWHSHIPTSWPHFHRQDGSAGHQSISNMLLIIFIVENQEVGLSYCMCKSALRALALSSLHIRCPGKSLQGRKWGAPRLAAPLLSMLCKQLNSHTHRGGMLSAPPSWWTATIQEAFCQHSHIKSKAEKYKSCSCGEPICQAWPRLPS